MNTYSIHKNIVSQVEKEYWKERSKNKAIKLFRKLCLPVIHIPLRDCLAIVNTIVDNGVSLTTYNKFEV